MLKRLFVIVLLVVTAAGSAGVWEWRRLSRPYGAFSGEIFVDLPAGSSVGTIAARLTEAGVVPDAWTFRLAARLAKSERRLQAGEYRFAAPATPFQVAWRLAHGDVFKITVRFPEGLTIADMAEIFAKSGLGTARDFASAAADPALVGLIAPWDPAATDLEGYVFPDTYAMPRRAGAGGLVRAMVRAFQRAFDARLRTEAQAQGLSLRAVVTLASIVEKETAQPNERPIIAAVYRNRLKIGMALQCDPTVIYALAEAGRWNGNLTRADLQLDSPYNTYKYSGLPPGPIAAPGKASLEAVLHPADVPYLYFVSRNDGTHVFATTLAEHNRNVLLWQVQFFRKR